MQNKKKKKFMEYNSKFISKILKARYIQPNMALKPFKI